MSAGVIGKKQCVTCSKSGGIMTCDGCQQSFCGKHSIEHRQELTNQLDEIMQEHDLLQQELRQSSNENSLLKEINNWEKESITKIQVAAEAARADLQQILDGSREIIAKTCRDIAVNLRSSREADDFSESDLNQWMEQLKELKFEITSPSSVNLVGDETSSIPLIGIMRRNSTIKQSTTKEQISRAKTPVLSIVQERFSQVLGTGVIIEEEGTVIRHVGTSRDFVHVLGERLYSQGRQLVRFRVGWQNIYNIFLGCTSFQTTDERISYRSPLSAGWFSFRTIYHQGRVIGGNDDGNEIEPNDVLSFTFDCENRQIELYHERTKTTDKLQINIKTAPFPWRLLVVLSYPMDCVRIIPND
jgi:hypothetical protein